MKKVSILATAIVISISFVALSVVFIPKLMGYKFYEIETDSMYPTIKSGSLIMVKPCKNITDYNIDDIVTFTDKKTEKSFTHRIVEFNEVTQSFVTKGDANEDNDPEETGVEYAVGKVQVVIPFVGKFVKLLRSVPMKIAVAVIYIAWAAIEIEIFVSERKKRYG